jgi:hypothetical protein
MEFAAESETDELDRSGRNLSNPRLQRTTVELHPIDAPPRDDIGEPVKVVELTF